MIAGRILVRSAGKRMVPVRSSDEGLESFSSSTVYVSLSGHISGTTTDILKGGYNDLSFGLSS